VKGDMVTIEDPNGGYKMELSADNNPVTIRSDNRTGASYGSMAFIAGNGSDANDITRMTIDTSGNVGIGTASPNDALEVAGNSATTHRIRINNANASGAETLAFVQDTTFKSWVEYNNSTGNFDVWQYTNNPLRFATNNTERARITSTGHLQVSTGYFELTSQPTTKLWLSTNQVQLYAGNLLVFGGYNASNDAVVIGNETGDINVTLAGGANDKVLYLEGSSGNVGIGTKTPLAKLDIQGTQGQLFSVTDNLSGSIFAVADISGVPIFDVNSSGVSYFDGDVGIGTTSPANKLEVNGVASFTGGTVGGVNDTHTAGAYLNTTGRGLSGNFQGYARSLINSITGGIIEIGQATSLISQIRLNAGSSSANGIVVFMTKGLERVRINADGTTKFNANILADVINNSANSANIIYRSGTTTIVGGGSSSNKLYVLDNGDVGVNDSSPSYKLDADGTIRATGDVIAYSDRRVKENIKTIDNALNKVLKLRGVSYNRKDIDDKSTKIGVIAQEVLETIPEVVEKDLEDKYSVAYGNMAGLFIEAIKELKAEIEELKKCKCDCKR
jgi:hypothetical protein